MSSLTPISTTQPLQIQSLSSSTAGSAPERIAPNRWVATRSTDAASIKKEKRDIGERLAEQMDVLSALNNERETQSQKVTQLEAEIKSTQSEIQPEIAEVDRLVEQLNTQTAANSKPLQNKRLSWVFSFFFGKKTAAPGPSIEALQTKIDKIENQLAERVKRQSTKLQELDAQKAVESQINQKFQSINNQVKNLNDLYRKACLQEIECSQSQELASCAQDVVRTSIVQANDTAALTSEAPHFLKQEYTIGDRQYSEIVTRTNSIADDVAICTQMIGLLQSEIAQLRSEGKNVSKKEKDLAYYEVHLASSEKALKNEETWITSNQFRNLLQEKTFKEGINEYMSVPVNMRYQELQTVKGEKICGFCRIGVISDMRNGFVSLRELKEIEQAKPKERQTKIDELKKRIEEKKVKQMKKSRGLFTEGKLTSNQLQSEQHALSQIEACRQDPASIVQERRRVLQKQMLHLVANQAKNHPELITQALSDSSSQFRLAHVCLLNQKKSEWDKTGWMHDERVEMDDMHEIFAEFDGKTILFDDKGPSIDDEGNVHLPLALLPAECENRPVRLATYFFNTSVQGNTKNNNFQLEINQESVDKLALDPKLCQKFRLEKSAEGTSKQSSQKTLTISDKSETSEVSDEDLADEDLSASGKIERNQTRSRTETPVLTDLITAKQSSYTMAEDLVKFLLDSGDFALSTGCLSAKDRTGVVGARVIQERLNDELGEGELNPYENSILDNNSIAAKVVAQNGHPYIKVNPLALGGIKGLSSLTRIGVLSNTAFKILSGSKSGD